MPCLAKQLDHPVNAIGVSWNHRVYVPQILNVTETVRSWPTAAPVTARFPAPKILPLLAQNTHQIVAQTPQLPPAVCGQQPTFWIYWINVENNPVYADIATMIERH